MYQKEEIMSYALLTDSSCNLPEDVIEAYGIQILPLTFIIDDEEYVSYLKGEHTDLQQFYTMMRDGKVVTTSLPRMGASIETIRELLDQGQDVLYLGFSSALSGTFKATAEIMDELASQYPQRTLRSVETLAASGGQGLLVLYAAEMSKAGASLTEVAAWVETQRLHLAHWFTVDDLMFLYRGGRVSRTSAKAGTLLSIKPVMHVDDLGRLIPVSKTRGRKRSIKALFEHMRTSFDRSYCPQHVMITHGDCIEDALSLKAMVEKEFGDAVTDVVINYVDPVIGAHSGPGTLALFFLATSRG